MRRKGLVNDDALDVHRRGYKVMIMFWMCIEEDTV